MTTKWKRVSHEEFPIKCPLIIEYAILRKKRPDEVDREIIFNENETITIESTFDELVGLDEKVKLYAEEKKLSYKSIISDNGRSTTFKPFNIVYLTEMDGSRKPFEMTEVYTQRLNEEIDKKQKVTAEDFEQLSQVFLLDVKSYNDLINLKFWNYHWIVKFVITPKLIVNTETQAVYLKLNCIQIGFEDKKIRNKLKRVHLINDLEPLGKFET